VATVEIQAIPTNNGLKPDMKRQRDVLEQYAIGSLKMMGSLEKNGNRWALIRASDGTLYRITSGRHIGKNNGKVVSITESQLELKEIVPDGLGGWIERMTTLAVSE
jgi:type IV pilus assembly protein PilP